MSISCWSAHQILLLLDIPLPFDRFFLHERLGRWGFYALAALSPFSEPLSCGSGTACTISTSTSLASPEPGHRLWYVGKGKVWSCASAQDNYEWGNRVDTGDFTMKETKVRDTDIRIISPELWGLKMDVRSRRSRWTAQVFPAFYCLCGYHVLAMNDNHEYIHESLDLQGNLNSSLFGTSNRISILVSGPMTKRGNGKEWENFCQHLFPTHMEQSIWTQFRHASTLSLNHPIDSLESSTKSMKYSSSWRYGKVGVNHSIFKESVELAFCTSLQSSTYSRSRWNQTSALRRNIPR